MISTYIALLRAVNVGGTGKLPMADLIAMCAELKFARIETYIASGNVVFESNHSSDRVQAKLAERLRTYAGKEIGVFVRTATEVGAILKDNPFHDKEPKFTYAIFLNANPTASCLDNIRGRDGEDVRLGQREIYVHYPRGMGKSKLQIPVASEGTARNLNTVAKIVEIACRK